MFDKKHLINTIVDTTFLFEQLDNDFEQISMMIDLFLNQSPPKIISLKKAIENTDYKEIKSNSHFLKSSFTIMGLSSKNLLPEVEKLSLTNSNIDKIKNLCNIIFKNHDESIIEYKKILSLINTK